MSKSTFFVKSSLELKLVIWGQVHMQWEGQDPPWKSAALESVVVKKGLTSLRLEVAVTPIEESVVIEGLGLGKATVEAPAPAESTWDICFIYLKKDGFF